MAYPVALAVGAALTATQAGLQMAAQSEAQSAVAKQRRQELARQAEFQKKASTAVAESLAQSDRGTAEQQIDAGAAKRVAEYNRITAITAPQPSGPQPVNRTVASPVATAAGNQALAAQAWNAILAPAQARAGGYADWGLQQNIKDRRAAEQIGVAGVNARNSAQVNQLELEQASHAGDGLAQIGNVLGAAGSVAGMYGATTATGRVGSAATMDEWGNPIGARYQMPGTYPAGWDYEAVPGG